MVEDDEDMKNLVRVALDVTGVVAAAAVCSIGGACWSQSVTQGEHAVRLTYVENAVKNPPEHAWLKRETAEIKALILRLEERQLQHEREHNR